MIMFDYLTTKGGKTPQKMIMRWTTTHGRVHEDQGGEHEGGHRGEVKTNRSGGTRGLKEGLRARRKSPKTRGRSVTLFAKNDSL